MAHTSTYRIWNAMRKRCKNPRDSGFRNYGGRGINVCERWEKFEHFLSDMGENRKEHPLIGSTTTGTTSLETADGRL